MNQRLHHFSIRSVPEIVAWQPPPVHFIVDKGILWPKSRLVVFGLWKSWKSVITQDLAFHISVGKPWLGIHTRKAKVLILQLEIAEFLFKQRIEKYAKAHQSFPDNLRLWTQHYLKLDRDYGVKFLEDVLAAERPDVLVIDPVYKVLTGNVSDSYDVSKFLDNIDLIIEKWGVSVVLVHHERKPQISQDGAIPMSASDMMGSSYFLNWLDTGIMLQKVRSTVVSITFDPMRHAEEEMPILQVEFNRSTLGVRLISSTQRELSSIV